MSFDISGFGSIINIIASNTAPQGFPITEFSDDQDAFDFPSVKIGDAAMGLNGDLIIWAKAIPLPGTISCIVGSDSDNALQLIAKNNLVGKNKANAKDFITITVVYPDDSTVTFTGGKMTDAMFGKSASSAGRFKTRTYGFLFESVVGQ